MKKIDSLFIEVEAGFKDEYLAWKKKYRESLGGVVSPIINTLVIRKGMQELSKNK